MDNLWNRITGIVDDISVLLKKTGSNVIYSKEQILPMNKRLYLYQSLKEIEVAEMQIKKMLSLLELGKEEVKKDLAK